MYLISISLYLNVYILKADIILKSLMFSCSLPAKTTMVHDISDVFLIFYIRKNILINKTTLYL